MVNGFWFLEKCPMFGLIIYQQLCAYGKVHLSSQGLSILKTIKNNRIITKDIPLRTVNKDIQIAPMERNLRTGIMAEDECRKGEERTTEYMHYGNRREFLEKVRT